MSEFDVSSGNNYTYYDDNLILPRVSSFSSSDSLYRQQQQTESYNNQEQHQEGEVKNDTTSTINIKQNSDVNQKYLKEYGIAKEHEVSGQHVYEQPIDGEIVTVNLSQSSKNVVEEQADDDTKPLFIPCPPSQPRPGGKIVRAQVHSKPRGLPRPENIQNNVDTLFNKRLPTLKSDDESPCENNKLQTSGNGKQQLLQKHVESPPNNSTPRTKLKVHNVNGNEKNLSKDQRLINRYKDFLNERFYKEFSSESGNEEENDISISVSSLSSSTDTEEENNSDDEDEQLETKTLTQTSFEPLYSLPNKVKKVEKEKALNKILISNSNVTGHFQRTGSLPDLRSIKNVSLKKVSHVTKNESEAESEPGAKIGYKFKPLPPIPGTSSNINNTGLYETIDGLSKLQKTSCSTENKERNKKKTFKNIATILTLVPRLTTNAVRSRKNDHRLADIIQYLPDKKLKIFVGTWNMKGTKVYIYFLYSVLILFRNSLPNVGCII